MGNTSSAAGGPVPICHAYTYCPGNLVHPGEVLLPPSDLLNFPTLPNSVLGQISQDGLYYDYYGKFGAAYDQTTLIDAPVGKAKKDYEDWIRSSPEIMRQVDRKIKANWERLCKGKEDASAEPLVIPGVPEDEMRRLEELSRQMLINLRRKKKGETPVPEPTPKEIKGTMEELQSLIVYKKEDWEPGENEKHDRDSMLTKVIAIVKDKEFSVLYKSGAILLLVTQYYFKRQHH